MPGPDARPSAQRFTTRNASSWRSECPGPDLHDRIAQAEPRAVELQTQIGDLETDRMTQIMNLLHPAPDIQEQVLFLPRVTNGRDPVHEKMLRPIAAESCWVSAASLCR